MAKKKKRKSSGERFVKLPHYLLQHPSWTALSASARLVLIELKRRYNGQNNGQITLSCREAGEVAGCSKNTASRALLELEYYGHIKRRRVGTFGNRHASEYILTSEPYNNQPATHDWKASRPAFEKKLSYHHRDAQSHHRDRNTFMEEQIVSPQGL